MCSVPGSGPTVSDEDCVPNTAKHNEKTNNMQGNVWQF